VKEGDIFYALATFVSETGEAMNLVEGERVYVLEWNNTDWYVALHFTPSERKMWKKLPSSFFENNYKNFDIFA
jgi:hypothetical protein